MKQLRITLLLGVGLVLAACATSSRSNTINGNWSAALVNAQGTPVFSFTITLSQNNGGTVTGSNLNFTSSNPCFSSGATETGAFTLTGTTNGVTSGRFQLTIQSTSNNNSATSNTLSMLGTLSNNSITGSWSLSGTGAGCTGSGNFTMNAI